MKDNPLSSQKSAWISTHFSSFKLLKLNNVLIYTKAKSESVAVTFWGVKFILIPATFPGAKIYMKWLPDFLAWNYILGIATRIPRNIKSNISSQSSAKSRENVLKGITCEEKLVKIKDCM